MGEFINPLDLKKIFVDYFLGSMELFIFGFIIIFSFICAKYGMGNKLYLTLLIVSLILISLVAEINGIYLIVIAIAGVIIFRSLAKLFN